MANEKTNELLEEAVKDEAFVKELTEAITAEEAQKVFASRGIDYTLEEVNAIAAGLKAKADDDELAAEDLEAVSGGIALTTVAAGVAIVGAVVGTIDIIRKWKW